MRQTHIAASERIDSSELGHVGLLPDRLSTSESSPPRSRSAPDTVAFGRWSDDREQTCLCHRPLGFDAVVQRVRLGDWSARTPCERWDARDLLNHNLRVTRWIIELTLGNSALIAATGDPSEIAGPLGDGSVFASYLFRGPAVGPNDDPVAAWNAGRDAVLEALDQPGATAVHSRSPWGHEVVDDFLGLVFYDPLVHTWDLAKAIGQTADLDPALTARAIEVIAQPGEGRNLRQPNSLADAVAVSSDADPTTQLVAASGRDPALWS
ncbi:MAG: hypothetical protein QOD72_2903 [Acidimicrobiaceae bacterium]|nr:hypothetical protein [Acidimicrobiaceae bacterium]